jgi:hypothetical protein
MSPRLDSLCLFERAPFGGGLGVRRVSLFGFTADDGRVLDLEEMAARIQVQLDEHAQLAGEVAAELAQLPEPPAPGQADVDVDQVEQLVDEQLVDEADVAEEARALEAAARAQLQELQEDLADAGEPAAAPADTAERVLELVTDPPPVRYHDAVARPCLRCSGGRRRVHGGCTLCQQRGVRAWVDGCEVGTRPAWKVQNETQRSAIVAALADALPELPETAVRGALDLLNIVLRGAPPEARTAALRRWDTSRLMIGAA